MLIIEAQPTASKNGRCEGSMMKRTFRAPSKAVDVEK